MIRLKLASIVRRQLSVARIVIVWGPLGGALLRKTTPVALLRLIPPVYVPTDCTAIEDTLPLSEGMALGLMESDPLNATAWFGEVRVGPVLGGTPAVGGGG